MNKLKTELKGFNYPLTPKGKSTLNPSSPSYYSADFLNIEFWSHSSAVAASFDMEELRRIASSWQT